MDRTLPESIWYNEEVHRRKGIPEQNESSLSYNKESIEPITIKSWKRHGLNQKML